MHRPGPDDLNVPPMFRDPITSRNTEPPNTAISSTGQIVRRSPNTRGVDPLIANDPWGRWTPSSSSNGPNPSNPHRGHYPVFETFEWEETDGAEVNSPSIGSASSVSVTYHTNTRPPGQEALLVDTGAVHNLTGQDFIERQTKAAMKHGIKTTWNQIPGTGKKLSGIGDSAKTATQTATVHGVLANGDLIQYEAPVTPPGEPGESSPVPPLYGLESMMNENVVMSVRTGLMALLPEGTSAETHLKFPSGTRFRQCVKAPSGHWTLPVSHWAELSDTE